MNRIVGVFSIFAVMCCTTVEVYADQSGTPINAGTCLSPEKLKQEEVAADNNDLFAARDLDVYYSSCVGDRDKTLARARKTAEIGTAEDVHSYAVIVESYEGKKAAFQWYLEAAQMGDSSAKVHVAEAYRDGDVVAKDPKQALMWFQLGATCQEFGVNDMEELAEFLWQQKPVPLAGPKALAWLTIVDGKIGLIPYYKTMRDDIIKTLSKDELDMANQLAGEYAYDAGCADNSNSAVKK